MTPITATVTGGTSPVTARLVVDGVAATQTIAAAPYVFQWNTIPLNAGSHTVAVRVVDGQGRNATSPAVNLTVDNTPPTGYTIVPTANQRVSGPITFKAHASDAYGVGVGAVPRRRRSRRGGGDQARHGRAARLLDAASTRLRSRPASTRSRP